MTDDQPGLPSVAMAIEMACEGIWTLDRRYDSEVLGFLPEWVTPAASPSMVDEIHNNYGHGGGWRDFEGFTVDRSTGAMMYPDDPVQYPIAQMVGHSEVLWLYTSSWVTVMDRATGQCRTARID